MYMSGVSSDVSDYGSEKGAMSFIEAMAGFGNLFLKMVCSHQILMLVMSSTKHWTSKSQILFKFYKTIDSALICVTDE